MFICFPLFPPITFDSRTLILYDETMILDTLYFQMTNLKQITYVNATRFIHTNENETYLHNSININI